MSVIYSDYSRDRIGWFFGLSGWQLAVVALSSLPMFWSVQQTAWASAAMFLGIWVLVAVVTVVPVRGRSAVGWIAASVTFAAGGLAGWSRFRARAAGGKADSLTDVDLPGALAGIEIHDGPPVGIVGTRVAIIQNHADKTWAITAAIVHPGIGLREADERIRQGKGLAELIDQASRTELIDEILFLVRTVPEDGAERDQWLTRHRRPEGPAQARTINDELQARLTRASVRTEAFVTVVVPESRIGKEAKESGGGFEGRARVLYGVIAEVEAQLKGAMGMTAVNWLTSPELARGLPHRVRPRRPRRHHRRDGRAWVQPAGQRRRPVGDGRPVWRRPRSPPLQPRRVELGLGHHQAAHQGRRHGCAGSRADSHRAR